jgi:hypothetical protein
MPNGTITSTENTFGTVNGALSGTVAGTLTGSVGVPGPQGPTGSQGPVGPVGPAGSPGQGVPVGGTSGQFLQKTTTGVDYATDWVTVNLAAYAVKANNLSDLTNFTTARSNLGLGTMATATAADYSTTSAANLLYAPIAAGQPTSGTVGQVLTKNSGTNYDSSWQTLIPGDRYLTTSTTSLTIDNNNKTLTVGTGLSYTPQQDVVIAYDASNHMHAQVLTYNSGTGVMTVDVRSHTGTGTFAAWTVNVGGTVPLASIIWGDITGTLGNQTDLANALNAKLEVTTAASTYQTQAAMSNFLAKADNLSGLANTGTARTNLGLGTIATVNEAPSDGSTYGRNNGAWVVAGGGSFPADALTTNEVNAVADAEYADFSSPSSVSITYGSGVLTFYDTSISSDGKLITINGGNSFALSSGSSWGITLMTDSADPGYPKYVENLVSFINGQGVSLTATWSGTTGTDIVDNLTSYSPLELNRVAIGIQSGDRLMIEQGLRQYLTSNALSLSAAYNDVLTYPGPDQNNIVSWGKPWQSENYATISLVSTKANIASPALTGNVTITTNSTSPALFITQTGTGNILTLHDQAADTTFVAIDQNGKINTIASTTANAGLNVPHGTAPTSPVSGDVWTTTGGLFYRISSTTQQAVDLGSTQTITGSKIFSATSLTLGNSTAASTINIGTGATLTATTKAINIGTGGVSGSTTTISIGSNFGTTTTVNGLLSTAASTATTAGFRIAQGVAPTAPVNGDIWATSVRLFARINGATQGLVSQADIGTSGNTATQGVNIANDATASGQTKTVSIGNGGAAGSLTSVVLGTSSNPTNVTLNGRTIHAAPGTASQNGASFNIASGTPANFGVGDIYQNGTDMFTGVTSTANTPCKLTAVKAYVNFSGTSTGTWAGGASTVTRTGGSTTCNVTTTTPHGLVQDNVVRALTGVTAGTYIISFISTTQFSFTTVETTALSAVAITFAVNTIRASQNVTSIADNGAGDYTVNFVQNIFTDVNYTALVGGCITAGGGATNGIQAVEFITNGTTLARTTAAYRFYTLNSAGVNTDALSINAVFLR